MQFYVGWMILTLEKSQRSLSRVLYRGIRFYPYKIQIYQNLASYDTIISMNFCWEFVHILNDDEDTLHNLLMSDQAHFTLSGLVIINKVPDNSNQLLSRNVPVWWAANKWSRNRVPELVLSTKRVHQ